MILLAGTWNVGEVFLARDALDAGDTGFALIIAFSGCGIVAGSLAAARTRTLPLLRARFLLGVAVVGAAGVLAGAAPVLVVALVAFFAGGFGNAFVVVHLRMVVQRVASPDMLARTYAAIDGTTAWGFAIAFLGAGSLLELIGPRALFIASGGRLPRAVRLGRGGAAAARRARRARQRAAGTCCVMQCGPPPPKASVAPGHADRLPARIGGADALQRLVVGRCARQRDDHRAVADVEVQVRGDDALALDLGVGQDREVGHAQPGGLGDLAVRREALVVRVVRRAPTAAAARRRP